MEVVKLLESGNSQTVELPENFRMPGSEVSIRRDGSRVILEPLISCWDDFFTILDEISKKVEDKKREQENLINNAEMKT